MSKNFTSYNSYYFLTKSKKKIKIQPTIKKNINKNQIQKMIKNVIKRLKILKLFINIKWMFITLTHNYFMFKKGFK